MAKELMLNTGGKIPSIGLGTWLSQPGEVGVAVETALKLGYRHIDCAHAYNNEAEIGESLQKCFKEGVVKREEVFLTSKLKVTEMDHDSVLPACQTTLKNLQLEYLDLYLFHWPVALRKGADFKNLSDEDRLGYEPDRVANCWKAMEGLVSKGLVKAVGISNFTITKTERLIQTAKIVPSVNQVECHLYLQQQKLKEYCDSKGIVLEAYSPLCNPGRPVHLREDSDPVLLEDPLVQEIASKHGATPAQVCVGFLLRCGVVVLTKSTNPARISENFKSTELQLDAEDMRRLRELQERNFRMIKGKIFLKKEESWEDLWDFEEDEKFTIKPPQAKKQKTGEV